MCSLPYRLTDKFNEAQDCLFNNIPTLEIVPQLELVTPEVKTIVLLSWVYSKIPTKYLMSV